MWKFVKGTDNKVIITSDGRVFKRYPIWKGRKTKRIVGWTEFREANLSNDRSGYLRVDLRRICNTPLVHRLVAETFIPNPENKPCVDHINGNKLDNRIENLRWVSHKENSNNPNTKWKGHRSWTNIQGFNPKTNHRTPVFKSLREASNWVTPEGKKINPGSLVYRLNKKIIYWNYFWTARLVTGEEYRDTIST